MSALAAKRCLNHDLREAVSRCPSCLNFFCRECVVVFEDRLICAACLTAVSKNEPRPVASGIGIMGISLALFGFLSTWFLFYVVSWLFLQLREHAPIA
jgi:hypothetical protein